jgi:superfamily II DNA or RNA helicase
MPTQVLANGPVNTDTLTGRTEFGGVREALNRLQSPEPNFLDRLHIISASSMMSHGVDVDRLNVMVMLGIPLSAAEFIQATARVGRKYPAIVFVVHKIGRERDAGVYRSFKQFVKQGDRFVEPVPVTRRSRQVLKRTIAGLEMARVLMIHEPNANASIATLQAFKQYIKDSGLDIAKDRDAILELLKLDSDLDAPLKRDLDAWFEQFQQNIEIPPNEARFPSDLSPTSRPMMSLRDVERQVPVVGSQI